SYVKVNLESKNIRFEPGADVKGPAILAVEVTPAPGGAAPSKTPPGGTPPPAPPGKPGPEPAAPKAPGPKGSAVIIGNSGFIQNTYIGLVGNRDLFTSAVAWLTQTGHRGSMAPPTS